jgi:hypothetical protein
MRYVDGCVLASARQAGLPVLHSSRSHRRVTTLAITLLLLLTLPLSAAITSSALTGRVTIDGAPTPGVTVTATCTSLQQPRVTTTNARGVYWLGALPPGPCDVLFARGGTTSLTRRAEVQLARVVRADAALTLSAEEESVTSTATTNTVAETTAITTRFTGEELDRLPVRRDVSSVFGLSPSFSDAEALIDDTPLLIPQFLGEETLEEVTVVRGAVPVDLDHQQQAVVTARTRSGGEDFTLSVRDTWSTRNGGGNVLESASGGRIVSNRLWFFAAGWGGEPTDIGINRLRGLELKLTGQPLASQNLVATWIDTEGRIPAFSPNGPPITFDIDSSVLSLRYTGVFGPRLTAEANAGRTEGAFNTFGLDSDFWSGKLSYRLGDHVLSAGGRRDDRLFHDNDFFASDRWATGRWTVDVGARREDEFTLPRIAATYDLHGNGTRAITASWGEYSPPVFPAIALPPGTPDPFPRIDPPRVATLGFASAIGVSGFVRADVLHINTYSDDEYDQLQLESRYRLFDRFEVGANWQHTEIDDAPEVVDNLANAWIGAQLPLFGHEFGATLLERYVMGETSTDIAVQFLLPVSRFGLTVAAETTDLFEQFGPEAERGFRFWVRLRV